MNKIPKEKIQKIIHIGIIIIASFVVGLSLQLVHAWTEPTLTAPNGNLGAPINTGASTQTKSGALYINGGVIAPIIWDTDNTAYYLNPFGTSQISSLYANGGFFAQGSAGLSFSDHNGGFNMIDNTWIRATGIGNIYAPGEMQATNIRANGNLCIGSDCRNSWAAGGLQLNTWQGGHYFASPNGEEYASIFYDTNNTGYYLNPDGGSQVSTIYANNWFRSQGDTGLYFQDHGSGLNMTDNTWIRAYGAGNIYAPGEMQATNIRANGNLCIGSDCRNSWPVVANSINWNTWQYGNYYQTNGDIYMGWAGNWLSGILSSKLQLNTWQGNHYSGSDGAEYATIFYDTNNTSFYLDPSGTSNLNTLNASTGSFAYITSVFGIRTPTILTAATFSDINNSSYYVTPSGTSNMNTIYANNIHFVNAYNDSDRRLKENITPLSNSLDKINQINGLSFYWKDKAMGENRNIGVIAQDVEKVYPELVSTNPKTGLKSVEYGNLVAPLIEAIKELTHKIDDLFSKYFDQQKQIDELRLEINALKNSR